EAGVLEQQDLAVLSAATAACAAGPTQSSANATGRPSALPNAAATGFSDIDGTTLPFGRSKWESTITLAPVLASSAIVGAWRSIRTASVTTPSFIGTFRSARTSTRFPLGWRLSSVLKAIGPPRLARTILPPGVGEGLVLDQLPHRHRGVRH